jgi:hypothetical protein
MAKWTFKNLNKRFKAWRIDEYLDERKADFSVKSGAFELEEDAWQFVCNGHVLLAEKISKFPATLELDPTVPPTFLDAFHGGHHFGVPLIPVYGRLLALSRFYQEPVLFLGSEAYSATQPDKAPKLRFPANLGLNKGSKLDPAVSLLYLVIAASWLMVDDEKERERAMFSFTTDGLLQPLVATRDNRLAVVMPVNMGVNQ